jgi:transposase
VTNRNKSAFVCTDPSDIVRCLVSLKDVRVLAYARVGPEVSLLIEQEIDDPQCPECGGRALVKERPVVQVEQRGHRGRKDDPLFRARRVLLMAEEKLDDKASERLTSLLELGDPDGEVAIAHRIKERLRDFYQAPNIELARTILKEVHERCERKAMPLELQRLGRTIGKWFDKIVNHHIARISNGPTESLNNLIKRIKRVGGVPPFDRTPSKQA